jgi:hypothetical protein
MFWSLVDAARGTLTSSEADQYNIWELQERCISPIEFSSMFIHRECHKRIWNKGGMTMSVGKYKNNMILARSKRRVL